MKIHRFPRVWNWIAALAVLVSAVMPAWSQAARVNGDSSPILEICTAAGIRWIDTGTGEIHEQAPDARHSAQSGHCAWCSLQPLALLPVIGALAPASTSSLPVLSPPVVATTGFQSWRIAQPRAPPAKHS